MVDGHHAAGPRMEGYLSSFSLFLMPLICVDQFKWLLTPTPWSLKSSTIEQFTMHIEIKNKYIFLLLIFITDHFVTLKFSFQNVLQSITLEICLHINMKSPSFPFTVHLGIICI